MEPMKQEVMTAVIIWETPQSNYKNTWRFVKLQLKQTLRRVENTTTAIQLLDSEGKQIGLDVDGDPSPQMRALMDQEFAPEPEEAATA